MSECIEKAISDGQGHTDGETDAESKLDDIEEGNPELSQITLKQSRGSFCRRELTSTGINFCAMVIDSGDTTQVICLMAKQR
jgi:hypothetical protein